MIRAFFVKNLIDSGFNLLGVINHCGHFWLILLSQLDRNGLQPMVLLTKFLGLS